MDEGNVPETMGICRVCHTRTVRLKYAVEPFTMSTVIGRPLARHPDGAFCTGCGLRYEFVSPDPSVNLSRPVRIGCGRRRREKKK